MLAINVIRVKVRLLILRLIFSACYTLFVKKRRKALTNKRNNDNMLTDGPTKLQRFP
jgi:hypothetical protein